MKPAHYKSFAAANKYASELAAIFPKRQFAAVPSNAFGYNVAVMSDGRTLALAGKRKPAALRICEAR